MRGPEPHRSGALEPHWWTARVLASERGQSTVYARHHHFPVGPPAGLSPSDPHPSAVEYLLGALGGDLLSSISQIAYRRGVSIHGLEASVTGRLNNPLVALGVVGETGDPGFEEISCTIYLAAAEESILLQEIWEAALAVSPLVHTLRRATSLSVSLQIHA